MYSWLCLRYLVIIQAKYVWKMDISGNGHQRVEAVTAHFYSLMLCTVNTVQWSTHNARL